MSLYDIYPIKLHERYDEYVHGFLNALFMRTSFSLRNLQNLGWKGINPLRRVGRGWTFSLKNQGGIYGLAQVTSGPVPEDGVSRYNLCYFPDFDHATQGENPRNRKECDNYYEIVRDFTSYPEFYPDFLTGEIVISLLNLGTSMWLTLNVSESLLLNRDPEGRRSDRAADNKGEQLFDISFPFFETLAATLNQNLESLPSAASHTLSEVGEAENPGRELKDQICSRSLSVGYGDADFESYFRYSSVFRNGNSLADFWKEDYRKEKPFSESMLWYSVQQNDKGRNNSTADTGEGKPIMIMLTGFLGSGKTTFLSHLIEYYVSRNKFVAVIQNEIGPRGLDARLLEDQYAVLEMDEGCVCCSLAGELRKGITRITQEINPDLIVLETTGLANPYNITGELDTISDLVRLKKIITLVDGENFLTMKLAAELVTDQILSADTLVINKCDMITNLQAEAIVKKLTEINPSARIVRCSYGDVNIANLMQPDGVPEPKEARSRSYINTGGGRHQTHSNENIRARKITLSEPLDRDQFLAHMEDIARNAFRIKGVIDFLGDDYAWLFQAVNGKWELKEMKHHIPDERFLIVISKDDLTVNLLDKLLLTKTINYEKINELSCCADGDYVGSL